MSLFEFRSAGQSGKATEVIKKYRAAEKINASQRREIYDVLKNEKHLCIGGERDAFKYVRRKKVSRAFLETVFDLGNLISLDLSNTEIYVLPDGIGRLGNLQYLTLNNSSAEEIPESIGSLGNLGYLDLNYTSLKELPESIGKLSRLQYLSLNYTYIKVLPESIAGLRRLQSLYLASSHLELLPECIGSLKNLRNLDLSNTLISKLPESIGSLSYLRKLNLSHTFISELPDSMSGMHSLRHLKLGNTKIDRMPEGMGQLNNLQTLDLDTTHISELPEYICRMYRLRELDLRLTNLSRLPASIGDLGDLEKLDLSKTRLEELPASIKSLKRLKSLDLSGTMVTRLSAGIAELPNLQSLILSRTQITELPGAIGKLPELKILALEELTLTDLPESLLGLNLPFIRDKYFYTPVPGIYINGLKLKNQPVEIFSQSREFIIGYYQSNKQSSPINECKIVFLGDGGAGKTLIVDRLMNDGDLSPDFNGETTPGICIRSRKYQIMDEEVELHFWDFGGQAIMHSMHRLFLTNRTLYVVVANARDNKANEQAWYWIRNIKSFADGAPVLLLVNQKDQNPSANVNRNGLQREYSGLKDVGIVTALKSTKEEFNTEIRDVICRIVSEMDTVHTPFSRSWLDLMNDLQEMPEDYITSDDFYAKCKDNGIETEKEVLDEIISWYQDLGVCFYSRKHPITRQYMVLKPRWLLNALYILIFNGRKYAVNGIIKETDIYRLICRPMSDESIKKVWKDIRYKPFEVQYIINVLQNFELIYRLDQEHYFLPMLCDENEYDAMSRFVADDTIHVSFEYVYLPENVLHCLMVRHGYELDTDIVWRTGAVFERKQCGWRALVRINGNVLDLYVTGEDRERHPVNSYLDMIRESVYRINRDMGLDVEEFIAYREGEKEERFEYQFLTGSREAGQDKVYSRVFKRLVNIDEILGILVSPKDHLTKEAVDHMLSALREMTERSIDLADRDEVKLTADFQSILAPVLNAKYNIQISREYTLGRSKKKIGETDLYFFRYKDGIKEELYILENKYIEKFTDQYRQLMGYLNPDFSAGITLSINRDRGWEEAFDYIYAKLESLKKDGSRFAPVLLERNIESKRTQFVKTQHIVPETGMTMPVYHLVLQLSDKARHDIAIMARR